MIAYFMKNKNHDYQNNNIYLFVGKCMKDNLV